MASNNKKFYGKNDNKSSNKNNSNDGNEKRTMSKLREMFPSFETDILTAVGENCNWKLNESIDTLITLSSSDIISNANSNFNKSTMKNNEKSHLMEKIENTCIEESGEPFLNLDEQQLKEQREALQQYERQVELCGLKVQYRSKSEAEEESHSDDDDADVVIEEESSDYLLSSPKEQYRVNACNFFAKTTQCPPMNTFPKAQCVTTPSPPPTNITSSASNFYTVPLEIESSTSSKQNVHQQSSLTVVKTPYSIIASTTSAAKKTPSLAAIKNTIKEPAYHDNIEQLIDEIKTGLKIVIIMRGIPGCGKSYLAQTLIQRTVGLQFKQDCIYSTDDFFTVQGKYKFDASKLSEAHTFNQKKFKEACKKGVSPIIIDNTNTQAWEMQYYAIIGAEYGYKIKTLEPRTSWAKNPRELERRNTHDIPLSKINQMLNRFEANISGERLLRIYGINYQPHNRPPQLRDFPPLELNKRFEKFEKSLNTHKAKKGSKKFSERRLIDNEALNIIAKEYANVDLNPESNESSDNEEFQTASSLGAAFVESTSFKEESLNQRLLGAIGSERIKNRDTSPKDEPILANNNDKPDEDQNVDLMMFPCENSSNRKVSIDDDDDDQWSTTDSEPKSLTVEAGSSELNVLLSPSTKNIDQSCEAKMLLLTASPSSTDDTPESFDASGTSSSPGSSERTSDIDISQYEMCDSGTKDIVNIIKDRNHKTKNENTEQTRSVAVSSLFDYFKNTFQKKEDEKDDVYFLTENDNTKKSRKEKFVKEISLANISTNKDEVLSSSESSNDLVDLAEEVVVDQHNSQNQSPISITVVEAIRDAISDLQLVGKNDNVNDNAEKETQHHVFKNDAKDQKEKCQNSSPIDNRNLIDWKDSEFPVSEITLPLHISCPTIEKSVEATTQDKGTYTEPYDFNIAYIGVDHVEDSTYSFLTPHYRDINQNDRRSEQSTEEKTPSKKLKLNKGTMTGTFSLDSAIVADTENRIDELQDKFRDFPRALIQEVYMNLCHQSFDWACDFLSQLPEEQALKYTSCVTEIHRDNIPSEQTYENSERSDSGSSSPIHGTTSVSAKKKRLKGTRNKLHNKEISNLEKEIQNMFILSAESYPEHTKKVKRWKNPKSTINFDADVASSSADTQQIQENYDPSVNSESCFLPTTTFPHPDNTNDMENNLDICSNDEEETIELKLGHEFINILESEFGDSSNPQKLDGLFPVIQIRKSMAQQLYSLWMESMQQQLWSMQEQLDAMIAKDAEYARSLEETEGACALNQTTDQPKDKSPNLKEIMDMEMALAMCTDSNNRHYKKEVPKDMALRVARQTLEEMFPQYDRDMILDIYEAHRRNFEETVAVIEDNCHSKSTLTMADVVKKQKHLINELHKYSKVKPSPATDEDDQATPGYEYNDLLTHEAVMEMAKNSRMEAQRQLQLYKKNNDKAAVAYRSKNGLVASYYSDVAKLHLQKVQSANNAAASMYLAAQVHVQNTENTIDLHYFHVSEAMDALKTFLKRQIDITPPGGERDVFIITGRGSNSLNGCKIRPAVTAALKNKNISFRFPNGNTGMIMATLKKKKIHSTEEFIC
ncbi:hypothetical protein TKK_0015844 [Trichogramma kaykai]